MGIKTLHKDDDDDNNKAQWKYTVSVEEHTRTKMLWIAGSIRYEASKGRRTGKGRRYYPKIFLDEYGETLFGKLSLQAKTPNPDLPTVNNWTMSHL